MVVHFLFVVHSMGLAGSWCPSQPTTLGSFSSSSTLAFSFVSSTTTALSSDLDTEMCPHSRSLSESLPMETVSPSDDEERVPV